MKSIGIDNLASSIMKELEDYADVTSDKIKEVVRKTGKSIQKEISANAPSDTGKYGKSWSVKNTRETSNSLEVVVYSKNRYQLTHLLEFGHAKRGGGRVSAKPHIAAAEENGIKAFEEEIKEVLQNG